MKMSEEHDRKQRVKQELKLKRELEKELDREEAEAAAAKKVKETLKGMLVLFGIALSVWVMCQLDKDEEQEVPRPTPTASVPAKKTATTHKPKAVTTSWYSSPKCKSIANTIEELTREFGYLSDVLTRSTVATLSSDIRTCRKLSKLVNRMIKLARKGERICRYEREKEAMDTVYTTLIGFQSYSPAGCN